MAGKANAQGVRPTVSATQGRDDVAGGTPGLRAGTGAGSEARHPGEDRPSVLASAPGWKLAPRGLPGGGEPAQVGVPGQHVARAADAEQRVLRPRIHSQPRPPEQSPSREPVALTSDDLLVGFFNLAFAMVAQAELDCQHQCSRGCLVKDDCGRRRLSAQRFLSELRAGTSTTIWADWLDLAEARARP